MVSFLLILVFLVKSLIGVPAVSGTTGDAGEVSCLDLAYCNLIKGDIARESEKYGKDPSKFYAVAESNLILYKENILKSEKDSTEKDNCKSLHDQCMEEASDMAVQGLNFPAKYQTTCNYQSYSKALFDCKNIQKWPKKFTTIMPTYATACEEDCTMAENQKITLTNGNVLDFKNTTSDQKKTGEVTEFVGLEERAANSTGNILAEARARNVGREILTFMAGYDDNSNGSEWGYVDTCPPNQWVHRADYANSGDTLNYVSMICTAYTPGGDTGFTTRDVITSTILGFKRDDKLWSPFCRFLDGRGATRYSFMIGISLYRTKFRDYGLVIRHVNYACASSGAAAWWILGTPDSDDLMCPDGSAVCSIQTKSDSFNGVMFLTNVRIGCCEGDPINGREHFRSAPIIGFFSSFS